MLFSKAYLDHRMAIASYALRLILISVDMPQISDLTYGLLIDRKAAICLLYIKTNTWYLYKDSNKVDWHSIFSKWFCNDIRIDTNKSNEPPTVVQTSTIATKVLTNPMNQIFSQSRKLPFKVESNPCMNCSTNCK
jgi:hypothetical protein